MIYINSLIAIWVITLPTLYRTNEDSRYSKALESDKSNSDEMFHSDDFEDSSSASDSDDVKEKSNFSFEYI